MRRLPLAWPILALLALLGLEALTDLAPARPGAFERWGPPPLGGDARAAEAWLGAAGPVELAAVLEADPPTRRWLRDLVEAGGLLAGLPPRRVVLLARALVPPDSVASLVESAYLPPGVVAVALLPGAIEATAAGCPHLPADLLALCGGAGHVRARLASVLARQLADPDVDAALRALALLVEEHGPLAVAAGERALRGPGPQGRAFGVVALAAGLGPDRAPARLRRLLSDDDPRIAMVAALELGRLGDAGSEGELAALEERIGGSAEGLVVGRALALATALAGGGGPSPGR